MSDQSPKKPNLQALRKNLQNKTAAAAQPQSPQQATNSKSTAAIAATPVSQKQRLSNLMAMVAECLEEEQKNLPLEQRKLDHHPGQDSLEDDDLLLVFNIGVYTRDAYLTGIVGTAPMAGLLNQGMLPASHAEVEKIMGMHIMRPALVRIKTILNKLVQNSNPEVPTASGQFLPTAPPPYELPKDHKAFDPASVFPPEQ